MAPLSPKEKSTEFSEKFQSLLDERGRKALEITREVISKEYTKIECKEVRGAIEYFMNKYWNDVMRPALLSIVCEAVGGNPSSTVNLAISSILIGGAIDIHDDIIDESKVKYGRQTVYGKFGKDVALLVGNALLFKGLTILGEIKELPEEKKGAIFKILKDMFFELGDAEAMELRYRKCVIPSLSDYLKLLEKKAADVEAHARLAAIFGGASITEIEKLGRYGRLLGTLIIMRDDILDLLDDQELKSRILKEHLPLPIICVCQDEGVKSKLFSLLQNGRITKRKIKLIQEFIEEKGGIVMSMKIMKKLAKEALSLLRQLRIKNKSQLRMLITFTLKIMDPSE